MGVIKADAIGKLLIDGLGLPAMTRKVEIIFEATKPVVIRCEFLVEDAAVLRKIVARLCEYKLVAKDD
jgi:hypothetical protein